ncbi:hypothetical protein [Gimesia fumaroli]|uniref:Uncharacterized protein n=1 Tax=Gimesia fumaroli TaxID=2527976 RepID=A0A518IBF2_9PLAN|nr:hypothetical protein [Gimesia fumaroli]QDV50426.1 hypothetical protein Enr17x_24660 [Gimesia fumaroli]
MRTSVTNPNPKLKTVAVVPFFNLSQEPDVDGRRFALAYYAELQKVPGFQVLPVGVAEVAMVEHELQMNNPDDVLKLAEVLNVDAVVIGAVTDYSPYYPPRIGMQVSWYSPHSQEFIPGLPLLTEERHTKKSVMNQFFKSDRLAAKEARKEEHQMNREVRHASHMERKAEKQEQKINRKQGKQNCPTGHCPTGSRLPSTPKDTVFRGQSAESLDVWPYPKNQSGIIQAYAQANQGAQTTNPVVQTPLTTQPNPGIKMKQPPVAAPKPTTLPAPPSKITQQIPSDTKQFDAYCPPSVSTHTTTLDPRQPFMSYTRLFDGSDAALVAHLRDYLEVSGDRRSGGWEAYLHRSEDFIRFTSHLMILEMLTLHGGQAQHQLIFKVRKYR